MIDRRPHSRACGIVPHEHNRTGPGPRCHPNCPTCVGEVRDEIQRQLLADFLALDEDRRAELVEEATRLLDEQRTA